VSDRGHYAVVHRVSPRATNYAAIIREKGYGHGRDGERFVLLAVSGLLGFGATVAWVLAD
jgi:hypothetical protein